MMGEDVKKSLHELYALTVCFGAMGFVAVYSALGLYDLVGIAAPTITISGWVRYVHSTNETYLSDWRLGHKDEPPPSEATLTAARLAAAESELRSERRNRIQDLVKAACFISVNLVIFAVHWRIARSQRNGQAVA